MRRLLPVSLPVATALAAALLLAGCDGGSDPGADPTTDPESTSTSASPVSADDEPAVDLYAGRRFDRLPDGDPQLLATIKEERTFPAAAGFIDTGGVVFGDDVAVLLPETQLLTAISLDTGKPLWQTRLPSKRGDTDPSCPLSQLPPGATVVTVMTGIDCAVFRHYDLATGKLVKTERNLSALGFPFIHEVFSLGRYTYWVDEPNSLKRLEGDGTSTVLMLGSEFGLEPEEDISSAMPITGSDTVLVSTIAHGSANATGDAGRYLGLSIPADGDPEVLWSERTRRALDEAAPPAPYVKNTATFIKEYGGIIETTVEPDIKHPRISRPDPDTGVLDAGFLLQRDPKGGFPAWADAYGKAYLLPMDDGMVSSSGAGGFAGYANLSYYDFGTNRIRWSYDAKLKTDLDDQQIRPVGTSSDGAYVYAMATADLDSFLVELDARTGKEQRRWTFPDKVSWPLNGATVYVHGDLMVWLDQFHSPDTKIFAATFRLG